MTYRIADPLMAGVGDATIFDRMGSRERSKHDETVGVERS
jgi:hypothetical protein